MRRPADLGKPEGPWWPTWHAFAPKSGWQVTNGDYLLGQHLSAAAQNGFRGYGQQFASFEAARDAANRQNRREGFEFPVADDAEGAFCPLAVAR